MCNTSIVSVGVVIDHGDIHICEFLDVGDGVNRYNLILLLGFNIFYFII